MEATATEGSFAGAARALNVTHAAVAQQVRSLEAHLGVRLTARQGRGIVLTPAGEELADALSDGFGRIVRAMEAVSETEAMSNPNVLPVAESAMPIWTKLAPSVETKIAAFSNVP